MLGTRSVSNFQMTQDKYKADRSLSSQVYLSMHFQVLTYFYISFETHRLKLFFIKSNVIFMIKFNLRSLSLHLRMFLQRIFVLSGRGARARCKLWVGVVNHSSSIYMDTLLRRDDLNQMIKFLFYVSPRCSTHIVVFRRHILRTPSINLVIDAFARNDTFPK